MNNNSVVSYFLIIIGILTIFSGCIEKMQPATSTPTPTISSIWWSSPTPTPMPTTIPTPDNSEAWVSKGVSLYNLGKYEEALIAYDKAIEINPKYFEAWNYKGTVLYNLGRYEEALIAYNKAIDIDNENSVIWSYKVECAPQSRQLVKV